MQYVLEIIATGGEDSIARPEPSLTLPKEPRKKARGTFVHKMNAGRGHIWTSQFDADRDDDRRDFTIGSEGNIVTAVRTALILTGTLVAMLNAAEPQYY